MPKVPTYDNRTVMPEQLPNNGFSVQSSPDAFGAGFGRVGEQYVGLFAEAKQRANVALAQDLSITATTESQRTDDRSTKWITFTAR